MQNPFSKMSPQMAAFLSGLAAALLAALLELIKDGQPFTINSVVYALASALGAFLVRNAIPVSPAPATPAELAQASAAQAPVVPAEPAPEAK